jgi:hypothetical protein
VDREANARRLRELQRQRDDEKRRQEIVRRYNGTFHERYRSHRMAIVKRIERDLRGPCRMWRLRMASGSASLPCVGEKRWWRAFTRAEGGPGPRPDLWAAKRRPNREEIDTEIRQFRSIEPSCPYFDRLYVEGLVRALVKSASAP